MCGIVGYIGGREACPILIDGLRRLEYRGYDSAGVATLNGESADIRRAEGKLANLIRMVADNPPKGSRGIGHTRWATHGRPSETNAHPHYAGPVVLVHNGIIENYLELKAFLIGRGHRFRSETDTEIMAHLVEEGKKEGLSLAQAVRNALKKVRGSYAFVVIAEDEPDVLVAAKQGSPLVIGRGTEEFHVASDIPAMLPHTREMIFLEDGEFAIITRNSLEITNRDGELVDRSPTTITWSPVMAEKGGFKHFMLKEIFEQPRAISDTIAGRISEEEGNIFLEDLGLSDDDLGSLEKVFIVACGTSWHAALVGKFLIEKLCRVPVEVDIASEFRYRNPLLSRTTLTILISQSGETADTLAALHEAREKGSRVLAICNVVGSSIARHSDGVIYTHAGPEIGVASTKAFTTQLVALHLFAIKLGRVRETVSPEDCRDRCTTLLALPRLVEETLKTEALTRTLAQEFGGARDFLYLGRGNQYPIALEGALKLKEISYIHAEGYPAGEMKHGPIALIDEEMPVVVVAPDNETVEKVLSNMEEVRARGGRVIAITTDRMKSRLGVTDGLVVVPSIPDDFMPIITSIPLQLLAYHIAVLRGTDVDQPRNLAKSVTVE